MSGFSWASNLPRRDLLGELLDVHRDRLEAERPEHFRVQLAHLAADAEALAVRGRADRPHLVGEMPKPVVPQAEQAVRSVLAHPAFDQVAKAVRERRADCLAVLHHEGQLQQLELGHPLREAHGRHVAEIDLAAFHHDRQVARGPADLEHAADQLEGNTVAELAREQLAEAARGAVVDRGGLLITPELECDRRHAEKDALVAAGHTA